MKELKIGEKIIECRRIYGLTQDELANYIGVSKASVSKWETSTTYPDITLLPRIASYFNITVDELLGYEAQMSKEQIKNSILKLSEDFLNKAFEDVIQECNEMVKKYYSCFPLLYEIGNLYVSESGMFKEKSQAELLLQNAIILFERIQDCSDEIDLKKQARSMNAMCLLYLNRTNEVLDLLGEPDFSFTSDEPIFAMAYRRLGDTEQAKTVLQVGLYQNIVVMMNLLINYLGMLVDDFDKFNETQAKGFALINAFSLEKLHPAIVFPFYLTLAQCYMKQEAFDETIDTLKKYTLLAKNTVYPISFKGDKYFDLMDLWFEEHLTLGHTMVRSEQAIKASISASVLENPAFIALKDNEQYLEIVKELNKLKEEM